MTALIILGCYALLGLLGARNRYRVLRPLTVPANCDGGILCNYGRGPHYNESKKSGHRPCFRSPLGERLYIDGEGEAVGFAVAMGLFWPVIFLAFGTGWAVKAGNRRQQPAELQARIRELERELGMR
jgi:hypothetical protein